jgi:hypothetical protein
MKQYTKDEAIEIIAANPELDADYRELKSYYDRGELDHSSSTDSVSCNFFNLIEDPTKVVIQYCYETEDYEAYELIVDSLEQAIITLSEIESARGNISTNQN